MADHGHIVRLTDETFRRLQERAVAFRSWDAERLDTPDKVIRSLLDSPTFTPDEIHALGVAVEVAFDDPESVPTELQTVAARLWSRFHAGKVAAMREP